MTMFSFFIKFYIVCGLIYATCSYTDDMRTRTMMRGRPEEDMFQVV
jgi:hypothetical protein